MFLSKQPQPVVDAVVKLAQTLVGEPTPPEGLPLLRVAVLVMPDGRTFYGSGSPDFILAAMESWQKDLTVEQLKMYSIPQIQPAVAMIVMYQRDFDQLKFSEEY